MIDALVNVTHNEKDKSALTLRAQFRDDYSLIAKFVAEEECDAQFWLASYATDDTEKVERGFVKASMWKHILLLSLKEAHDKRTIQQMDLAINFDPFESPPMHFASERQQVHDSKVQTYVQRPTCKQAKIKGRLHPTIYNAAQNVCRHVQVLRSRSQSHL